jgi:ATP/maltotriose-dependent transcriptional regulator MalT/DNA-binding transcriptional ArsR family regulator
MEIQTPELLKILSNKTNLEIINLLKNEPSYPRKISEILGMQEAYISRVLSHLEKLGILRSKWVYRERNVKLYSVDAKEINITFEPEALKIHVRQRGEKEISISYDAFTFEVPEIHGFMDREKEIEIFDKSSIILVIGIAGIGKTYLASKYVQKVQKEGKKIFWHTFTEIDSFHYLINKISVFLNNVGYSNLLEYIKQEGKDERVLLSLFQQGITEDMVFCFDGFQQVHDTKIVALFKWLKSLKGKIIITSRERPSFLTISRTDIAQIRLSALSEQGTREFLQSRGVPLDDGILRKAHCRLGGHPLILDMFCEAVRKKKAADLLESLPVDRVEDYLWSEILEKLSEQERKLIEWLSVFRTPASSTILKQIYKMGQFWTILKGLEKRLLIKRQDSSYVLPSMIREFTYQNVPNKRLLHREIAAAYLEEGRPEGLLEAMYHFLQAGAQERAAEIVGSSEEVDLIERGNLSSFMEILNQFHKEKVRPEQWCSIKNAKGRILVLYGDAKNAFKEFEEMQTTAEYVHSEKDYAKALHQLGNIHTYRGEWKKAHTCFEQSLHVLEELKDYCEVVKIYADIGLLLRKQNNFGKALSHFEAGKEIAEEIGYKFGVSMMLRHIASIYYYQDQFDTALEYHKQSLQLAEKSLDVRCIAANYNSLGLIYFNKGEFQEAQKYFEKDMEISDRISDNKAKIESYANVGMVFAEMGENEKAETYYGQALELAEELEDLHNTAYLKMKTAYVLLHKGEREMARSLCEVSLELFEQLGESLFYGEFCRIYGMVLQEMGEWEKAQECYEKSIEELSYSPLDLGKTYLEYALGLKMQNDAKAEEDYQKALALFERVSAEREIENARRRWEAR